jgi:hypothetical protein
LPQHSSQHQKGIVSYCKLLRRPSALFVRSKPRGSKVCPQCRLFLVRRATNPVSASGERSRETKQIKYSPSLPPVLHHRLQISRATTRKFHLRRDLIRSTVALEDCVEYYTSCLAHTLETAVKIQPQGKPNRKHYTLYNVPRLLCDRARTTDRHHLLSELEPKASSP